MAIIQRRKPKTLSVRGMQVSRGTAAKRLKELRKDLKSGPGRGGPTKSAHTNILKKRISEIRSDIKNSKKPEVQSQLLVGFGQRSFRRKK